MNGPAQLDTAQAARLKVAVTEAYVEMFTSFGFIVHLLDTNGPVLARGNDIVAFIGFAGDAVRGSLMMSGPKKLFRSIYPSELLRPHSKPSEMEVFDWTAEIANQLLGRVKKRFCEQGREFYASTPTAVEGRELGRRFPGRAGVLDLVFAVGGDVVSICFEITPPDDGKIFPDIVDPMEVSNAGDLLLF